MAGVCERAVQPQPRTQKSQNLTFTQVFRRMGHQCNDTILSASVLLTPAMPRPCASNVMQIKPIFHSEFGQCHQISVNTSIPKFEHVRHEGMTRRQVPVGNAPAHRHNRRHKPITKRPIKRVHASSEEQLHGRRIRNRHPTNIEHASW